MIKEFWCWVCHAHRKHAMITEELGTCLICGTKNWAPTGDLG